MQGTVWALDYPSKKEKRNDHYQNRKYSVGKNVEEPEPLYTLLVET